MLYFEPWKKALIAAVCLLGLLATLPNFFYEDARSAADARRLIESAERLGAEPPPEAVIEAQRWPSWLPSGVVNLGLDLQGGSHFLLEAQMEQVYRERLDRLREAAGPALREAGVRRYRIGRADERGLPISITNAEDVEAARGAIEGLAQLTGDGVFTAQTPDLEVTLESAQTYRVTLTEEARLQLQETTLSSAIEVIRTRVDALGTREPTIQRQGSNRILLQLPGESDVDITELTKPARLTFHMVAENVSPADAAAGRVPRGVTAYQYDEDLNEDLAGQSIAVFDKIDIYGEQLAEAQQGTDQFGVIGVNIRFDASGARIFSEITRNNVNRRFAMILDGKVLSAPSIRVPILDGAAIITGSFTPQSARALAVNLSSGSLPTTLTVEESSVVGPELGQDSIDAGRIACIVGFVLVLIYMALSYGLFGLFANVALLINVALIFGALSMLGATLTLPGIAGVVLTIGMAVDANVLVFERIREELKRGRSVVRAIETGYERALSAIIDANVTTFIAAAILFAMGSGPVRGFSVTLAIGIITSVFTAVMLTRLFVSSWYGWSRAKELAL
ncbi:MAG: protein translocase subunit SecD [Pseudomonadota bacterium]